MKIEDGAGGRQAKAIEKMEARFNERPTEMIKRTESKGRQVWEEQTDQGRSRRPSNKREREDKWS